MAGGQTRETYSLRDVKERTYKPRDAWWTVVLVDPFAAPLVKVVANRTSITPNQLTFGAMLLGLGAAWSFWQASAIGLVVGALLFHLSFVVDCMDGKVARLKGTGSMFGTWLDFLFDRVRDVLCAVALFGGQYRESDEAIYLYAALAFVAVNMFRYLDGSQIAKVRRKMNQDIVRACLARGLDPALSILGGDGEDEGDESDDPVDAVGPVAPGEKAAAGPAGAAGDGVSAEGAPVPGPRRRGKKAAGEALNSGFLGGLMPRYRRIRTALLRYRIRTHLFSGIELQMTTFIVAPLVAAVWHDGLLVVLAVAIGLTLLFEAVLVAKLWSATRAYGRVMRRVEKSPLLEPVS